MPATRPSRETFSEYADRWLAEHRPRVEPGTYSHYRGHLEKRLKPWFGQQRLGQISRVRVRAFVAHHHEQGKLAPMTINHGVILLSTMLGHAVEDGLIPANPAGGRDRRSQLTLPRPHAEMDYLRLGEIPAYLDACDATYRPLAELLVATGLRVGEALALQWGDVDWLSGSLVVSRNLKPSGVGATKTRRTRRVEVGPRQLARLRDLRARQAEHRDGDDAGELLFPHPAGGHTSAFRAWRQHKAACKRAGLRQTLRLHDLRHTAAAAQLASGLPMMYVQRQLGHANISTTIDRYGHLEESFLREAARQAEEAIWPAHHQL